MAEQRTKLKFDMVNQTMYEATLRNGTMKHTIKRDTLRATQDAVNYWLKSTDGWDVASIEQVTVEIVDALKYTLEF